MTERRCDKCEFWRRGGIDYRTVHDAKGNPTIEHYWSESTHWTALSGGPLPTQAGSCLIRSAQTFPRRHGFEWCGEFSRKDQDSAELRSRPQPEGDAP